MMHETKEDVMRRLQVEIDETHRLRELQKLTAQDLDKARGDLAAAGAALGAVRTEYGQLRGELAAVHEALKDANVARDTFSVACNRARKTLLAPTNTSLEEQAEIVMRMLDVANRKLANEEADAHEAAKRLLDEREKDLLIAWVDERLLAMLDRSPDARPLSTRDALAAVESALRYNRGERQRLEARREGGTPNSPRAAADVAMLIDAKDAVGRFEARFEALQREHAAEVARLKREHVAEIGKLEERIEEEEEEEEDRDTLESKLHAQVSAWLERTAPRMKSDDLDYATIKLTILQPASEEDGTLYLEFRVEEESHFESDASGGNVPGVKL